MKRVFISQPMKGLTNRQIRIQRESAKDAINDMYSGEDIIFVNDLPKAMEYDGIVRFVNPLKQLGKSIKKLSDADIAYFCEGWKNARGCRIEHECATEYKIEIIEEKDSYAEL